MSQVLRNLCRVGAVATLGVVIGGCALFEPPRAPPPAPPPSISIARLYEQPAERAFINGMRFYEDGQYERAEVMFKRALAEGLHDRSDMAAANKHLAFIACAYSRPTECESAFRAAFTADPNFKLTMPKSAIHCGGPFTPESLPNRQRRRRNVAAFGDPSASPLPLYMRARAAARRARN